MLALFYVGDGLGVAWTGAVADSLVDLVPPMFDTHLQANGLS